MTRVAKGKNGKRTAKRTPDGDKTLVQVWVDQDLHDRIRRAADAEGLKIVDVVRRVMLREWPRR